MEERIVVPSQRPTAEPDPQGRVPLWFSRRTARRIRTAVCLLACTLVGLALLRHLAEVDRRGEETLFEAAWLVSALRVSGAWLVAVLRAHSWLLLALLTAACLAIALLAVRGGPNWKKRLPGLLAIPLALFAVVAFAGDHPLVAIAGGVVLAACLAPVAPASGGTAPVWARATLAAVVVLALVLRCFALASWPVGYPEHAVVHHTSLSLPFYEQLGSALRTFDLRKLVSVASTVVHDQHGPDGLLAAAAFSLLGVTLTVTQLTSAALGILTVIAAYGLGRILESWRTGLILAGLVAASPWNVSISRYGDAEHVLAPLLTFIVLGLLLRALDSHRLVDAVLAAVCLGVSWYVYAPAQILPVLAVILTLAHALRRSPWRGRGAWIVLAAVATFAAVSLPAIVDFAARGRLIPIRSSYQDERLRSLLNPSRVLALSFTEWRQLFVETSDPWFARDGGGLGATEAALLLPGLVLLAVGLRSQHTRDRAVLLLVALPLSSLPAILAPDESFRRLFLAATFTLVIASVVIARTVTMAVAAGVRRVVVIAAVGATSLAYVAANTHIYFDTVTVHESAAHIYDREVADLLAARLGHQFVTVLVRSEDQVTDHERYITLAAYERLGKLAEEGKRRADLYAIVPLTALPTPSAVAAIVARGGVLVALDEVLSDGAAGRTVSAALRTLVPEAAVTHHGTPGGQPWTEWQLGGGSTSDGRLLSGGSPP
jgi:hypothetical protein